MPRFHMINGNKVPFTPEEEIRQDAEDVELRKLYAARDVRAKKFEALAAKLQDDSITYEELKEYLRMKE